MDATRPLTPAPPVTTVMRALLDRAGLCSREAGLAKNTSAEFAEFRAMLRAETQVCNALAAAIRDMDPVILRTLDALLKS